MLQEEHDKRRVQLVEQTAPDHFIRDLRDQECWRCISYQESNNNSFFSTSMKLVGQFRDNKINILECATKLGRLDRMYSEQTGMFNIPIVDDETLRRLHAMTFGIPSIDDNAYKCTQRLESC